MQERASGVLLHPTSLPGPWGIGDLGPTAHRFLDWLEAAGQSVWQILPLGPTGGGDSPYGATSSFAGNPLLISPQALIEEGFLPAAAATEEASACASRIDYSRVSAARDALLRQSWSYVSQTAELDAELEGFARAIENRSWLDDWTLFAALKRENGYRPWTDWPEPLRMRQTDALAAARERLGEEIRFQSYLQFLFFRQWAKLHDDAGGRGIQILGDLPIYAAPDSADVWTHQDLFELDQQGRPTAVGGVPPDAFTDDGQTWGNPLYRWNSSGDDLFRWWTARVEFSLRQVDLLRLDHYRGFAAYWRVPVEAKSAREGTWVAGPGADLFLAIQDALGELPLIAEDLGVITPDVVALKERFGVPGMKVLQFGFDELDSPHLPHHHSANSVVYTGTHDNDTVVGWYSALGDREKRRALDYLGASEDQIHWGMIRAAMTSRARLSVFPVQDLLGLASEARMNIPGVAEGNWTWRLREGGLDTDLARLAPTLRRLSRISGRIPGR